MLDDSRKSRGRVALCLSRIMRFRLWLGLGLGLYMSRHRWSRGHGWLVTRHFDVVFWNEAKIIIIFDQNPCFIRGIKYIEGSIFGKGELFFRLAVVVIYRLCLSDGLRLWDVMLAIAAPTPPRGSEVEGVGMTQHAARALYLINIIVRY